MEPSQDLPVFDPEREQIGAGPLWVRLPGLPLQYWCEEAFIRIGNALGTYLDHDRTLVESRDRTVARILVHFFGYSRGAGGENHTALGKLHQDLDIGLRGSSFSMLAMLQGWAPIQGLPPQQEGRRHPHCNYCIHQDSITD